jgi:hypothetical protein
VSGLDWQRGKGRDHDRAEAERLRRLGVEHGEPAPATSSTKRVHPNSMAARKWKRSTWRTG